MLNGVLKHTKFQALLALAVFGIACDPAGLDKAPYTTASALAESGGWNPSADVLGRADTQNVAYNGPSGSCAGALKAGPNKLGTYLTQNFAGISKFDGYACRKNTADSSKLSIHAMGRALDVYVPQDGGDADNGVGDKVANWLIVNASAVGVQMVIWDRKSWTASRAAGQKLRDYTGPNPHTDHIHVELNNAGAAMTTAWFQNGAAEDPEGAGQAPTEETPDGGVTGPLTEPEGDDDMGEEMPNGDEGDFGDDGSAGYPDEEGWDDWDW